MNEAFIIGKIKKIEYKFVLEKRKNSKSKSKTGIIGRN